MKNISISAWIADNIFAVVLYFVAFLFATGQTRWVIIHTVGLLLAVGWSVDSFHAYRKSKHKGWLISLVLCVAWFVFEIISFAQLLS